MGHHTLVPDPLYCPWKNVLPGRADFEGARCRIASFAFIRHFLLGGFCKFFLRETKYAASVCKVFIFCERNPDNHLFEGILQHRVAQMLLVCVKLKTALALHFWMDFVECSRVVREHQENRISSSVELSDLCLWICDYVLMCVTRFGD